MFKVQRLELTSREKQEFLELMSSSLNTHSVDWLEWKYVNNPKIIDQPTVFGVIHKSSGILVGIRPFLACDVVLGNKTFKAAQPCDTVVHPKFRGKGLFSEMNRVAIEELTNEGYDLFFNFPNRNSQPGYLKMGWEKVAVFDESFAFNNFRKVVGDTSSNTVYVLGGRIMSLGLPNLPKLIKKLDIGKGLSSNSAVVSIKESFDDDIENMWLNKEKNRFRIKRDSEYLNWRFRERPDKAYKYWTLEKRDNLLAYAITTISHRWGSKEGQIVDFNFIDAKYFFVLLEAVLKQFHFNDECNFVSILACTENTIFRELKRIGFIHRFQFPYSLAMPERNFVVRAINPELENYGLYKKEKWSLRASDQDTY